MTDIPHDIFLFLGFAFRPSGEIYTKAELESTVEQACITAETNLCQQGHNVRIHVDSHLDEFGLQLNQQLRAKIRQAHIVVVELSDSNVNVCYELGLAHAQDKRTIIMQADQAALEIPSDVDGMLVLRYSQLADIQSRLAQNIERAVPECVRKDTRYSSALRGLWSFQNGAPTTINLVAPDTRRRDGLPVDSYSDFTPLEQLGDKDAVVLASIQLARLYPDAEIVRYSASAYPQQEKVAGIVCIGGPLGENGFGGNILTRHLTDAIGLPISYSEDCERLMIGGVELPSEYEPDGHISVDYGVVARIPNPWNKANRVLLVHGIHTYGVLGAVRAITFGYEGGTNAQRVREVCGDDPLFYAWCKVRVIGGSLITPLFDPYGITPLTTI